MVISKQIVYTSASPCHPEGKPLAFPNVLAEESNRTITQMFYCSPCATMHPFWIIRKNNLFDFRLYLYIMSIDNNCK
jgi:hypothetical protein